MYRMLQQPQNAKVLLSTGLALVQNLVWVGNLFLSVSANYQFWINKRINASYTTTLWPLSNVWIALATFLEELRTLLRGREGRLFRWYSCYLKRGGNS